MYKTTCYDWNLSFVERKATIIEQPIKIRLTMTDKCLQRAPDLNRWHIQEQMKYKLMITEW